MGRGRECCTNFPLFALYQRIGIPRDTLPADEIARRLRKKTDGEILESLRDQGYDPSDAKALLVATIWSSVTQGRPSDIVASLREVRPGWKVIRSPEGINALLRNGQEVVLITNATYAREYEIAYYPTDRQRPGAIYPLVKPQFQLLRVERRESSFEFVPVSEHWELTSIGPAEPDAQRLQFASFFPKGQITFTRHKRGGKDRVEFQPDFDCLIVVPDQRATFPPQRRIG